MGRPPKNALQTAAFSMKDKKSKNVAMDLVEGEEEKVEKTSKNGPVSIRDLRKLINKKSGNQVAFALDTTSPSDIKEWIPTGSTILDYSICRGKRAGWPVGRCATLASLPGRGKSYFAAVAAANALKMNPPMKPVYFDSESAIDSEFLSGLGCDLSEDSGLIYVQATSVEQVLETIETMLSTGEKRFLFIWDSLANTPTSSDNEGTFSPQETIALKARILSKGFQKLTNPIANSDSTFLILNQLKHNIGAESWQLLIDPFVMGGGKSILYSSSLIVYLEDSRAQSSFVKDDHGFKVGTTVQFKIKKSRFGTEGRVTTKVRILWGGSEKIGVMDEESWLDALKEYGVVKNNGPWLSLVDDEDADFETGLKFQASNWLKKINEEPEFKAKAIKLLEDNLITKFANRTGDAKRYFGITEEPTQE